MTAEEFKKREIQKKLPISQRAKKTQEDVIKDLISGAYKRIDEINHEIYKIDVKINKNQFPYLAKNYENKKKELISAWRFNKQFIESLTTYENYPKS